MIFVTFSQGGTLLIQNVSTSAAQLHVIFQTGLFKVFSRLQRKLRFRAVSAVKEDRILLIGGVDSRSTEWILVDGSPSQPGPFEVRHGSTHCTIQLSADSIVVTGGYETEEYVTKYELSNGNETPLTPMVQSRFDHACGVYQDAGGQQVRVCLNKHASWT